MGDFQRAVGTMKNLLLVFHGFHGPAFSTDLGCGIAADRMGTEADGDGSIQMLVNRNGAAGQGTPELGSCPLARCDPRSPPCCPWPPRPPTVKIQFNWARAVLRKLWRSLWPRRQMFRRTHRYSVCATTLWRLRLYRLRPTACGSRPARFRSYARIGPGLAASCRYHLHSQPLHRSSYLRQTVRVHVLTRLRRHEKMTAPFAIQCAEQALALDHFP